MRTTVELVRHGDPLLIFGAITYFAFDVASLACAFQAFGGGAPPLGVFILAYTLGHAGALLPTPGGVGGTEGGLIGMFVAYGTPLDLAAAAVLGYRVFQLGLPAVLGAVSLLRIRTCSPTRRRARRSRRAVLRRVVEDGDARTPAGRPGRPFLDSGRCDRPRPRASPPPRCGSAPRARSPCSRAPARSSGRAATSCTSRSASRTSRRRRTSPRRRRRAARGRDRLLPRAGSPTARAAAAELRARAACRPPEHVMVANGAKPFLLFTVLAACEPGDEVVYPDPGFPIYESAIRFAGAAPGAAVLREHGDFALLGRRARARA